MKLIKNLKKNKGFLMLVVALLPFYLIANSFTLSNENNTLPGNSVIVDGNVTAINPELLKNSENSDCNEFPNSVTYFSDDVLSYILIAKEEIELKKYNVVTTGALGVLNSDKKIKIQDNSNVYGFAKASVIEVDGSSSVGSSIFEQANIANLPPFLFNYLTNGDSPDIVIEENQTMTLDGTVYGKVEVKNGGTVIFTQSDIFLKELKTSEYTSVKFAKCGNVFLQKGMELGKHTSFNQDRNNVIVYADYNVKIEEGSDVISRIYIRDNDLEVKGSSDNPTTMGGIFFAKKIKGENHVSWRQELNILPCKPNVPEQPCQECKGGLLELTLQYNGVDSADVMVLNNDDEVLYSGNHASGEEFTFVGLGDYGKMSNSIYLYINGVEVVDVHTSCSQPIGAGSIFDDFTVVSGISKDNGPLCPYESEPEACECNGGLSEITVSYSGGAGAILTSNSGTVTDNGDGTYTVYDNGIKLEKDLEISNGLETAEIHTSCSQDILGFTFAGGMQIVSYTDMEGNSSDSVEGCTSIEIPEECECNGGLSEITVAYSGGAGAILTSNSGTVTDNGDGTYTVYDNGLKLEKDLEISNGLETAEIHTSCSQDILGFTFAGGMQIVSYTDMEGNNSDSIKGCTSVEIPGDCECSGGVVELSFLYFGATADIMVLNDDDVELYSGNHSSGTEFTFIGLGDENRMTNSIYFYVNGVIIGDLHTSCSKPIGPGLTIGDLYMTSGLSRDNGVLCDYEPECECKGGLSELGLSYTGTLLNANIIVLNENDEVLYTGTQFPNGVFSFIGLGDGNKMTKNIYVWVNGVEVLNIHTSCSQPIDVGTVLGDFTVTSGTSVDNGPFCGTSNGSGSKMAQNDKSSKVLNSVLWPNPSNNVFNLKVNSENKSEIVNIQLFDINGKLLLNKEINNSQEFSFGNNLISGIYFVKIKQGAEIKTAKLIKY